MLDYTDSQINMRDSSIIIEETKQGVILDDSGIIHEDKTRNGKQHASMQQPSQSYKVSSDVKVSTYSEVDQNYQINTS